MAILIADDFPGGSLTAEQIDRLIISAQRLAESTLGAGRPLEITEFVDLLPVNKVMQTAQLKYWPVLTSPAPIIEVRQSSTLTYGRSHGTSQWTQIDADEYILDESGKIHLKIGYSNTGFNRSTLLQSDEVRATYSSGLDFSVPSYEVDQVKSAVLAVAVAQSSQQYQSNLSKASIEGEVSVQFSTSSGSSSSNSSSAKLANPSGLSLQESMEFLKKYSPRAY